MPKIERGMIPGGGSSGKAPRLEVDFRPHGHRGRGQLFQGERGTAAGGPRLHPFGRAFRPVGLSPLQQSP
jgi:hypothetical protein